LNAAKEKLEIVIDAAPPQILNFFAGGLPRRLRRRNAFGLIQEYCATFSMPCVYILQSLKDNRTYVGYAIDVWARLLEHNSGKVRATKHRRPLEVLYTELCKTLKDAKRREKYWKSGGGRRKLKLYFKEGFPPSFAGRGSPKLKLGRRIGARAQSKSRS